MSSCAPLICCPVMLMLPRRYTCVCVRAYREVHITKKMEMMVVEAKQKMAKKDKAGECGGY